MFSNLANLVECVNTTEALLSYRLSLGPSLLIRAYYDGGCEYIIKYPYR